MFDESISLDKTARSYTYQEDGFETSVRCIYNESSALIIADTESATMLYAAEGMLPNSDEPEYSVMVGHGMGAIVAMGVGRNQHDPRRIVGIAAGEFYQNLNSTQCTLDFTPTWFNITVGLQERNITVTPAAKLPPAPYQAFSAEANLTQVVTRQLELISNMQINLYASLLGNSLNASIADFIAASQNSTTGRPMSFRDATLPGLSNAITAMVDDMLVAYGSAQLMIAKQYSPVPALFTSTAMRIGQNSYIYATLAVNCVVLILFVSEGIRTRGWTRVPILEYSDPAALIIATSVTRDTENRERRGTEDKALVVRHEGTYDAKLRLGRDMSLALVHSS